MEDNEELIIDNYSDNSTKMYLSEISKIPILNKEEEFELARLMIQGDMDAKYRLIRHNLRFVVKIVQKYIGCGLDILDLIQYGNLGLIEAVEKFDIEKECRLNTYADFFINKEILRGIKTSLRFVRLPEYIENDLYKLEKSKRKLEDELNREPTLEELEKETDFSKEKIKELLKTEIEVLSFDKPLDDNDKDGETLEFYLAKEDDNFKELEQKIFKENAESILDCLTPQEKRVLMLRYGIEDNIQMSSEEISKKLNLTKENVRKQERNALFKLRHTKNIKNII